jgi:sugar phosphate isomerase/epimerase
MMKTSFSTLACPEWGLPEVLRAAATYGYDGIELRVISRELDLWNLPEFKSPSLSTTRAAIQDQGLVIASMGSSACFHSPDARERERNLDSALRMAEVAAGIGAPSIRVFGDHIQTGCERKQTASWIADSITQLADRLKPAGVQVWLETHGDFASAADVSEIFAQMDCPRAGIIWDPANAFEKNGEAPLIPSQMSSHIRHVHLKDLKKDAQGSTHYMPTGEGEFPFSTMFASLAGIAFDGFVSFEWEKLWHPELAAPEVALPHFIKWWKGREAPGV